MYMKLFLATLLISFSGIVSAQKHLDKIYLKRSLKQDGEQYQFTILDEDKHGVFIYDKKKFYYWYKAQHVLATQGAASGDILHGEFEAFYENKQLSKKGKFVRGLKDGEWMYWRLDGTLYLTENWSKGKLSGTMKLYDEKGEIKEVIRFKGNKSKRELADSTIFSRNDGKYETVLLKDTDGKVISSEEKKNGKLHGKVKVYEDGKLREVRRYSNGELTSTKTKEQKVTSEKSDKNTDTEEKKLKRIFGRKSEKEIDSKNKEDGEKKESILKKLFKRKSSGNAKESKEEKDKKTN